MKCATQVFVEVLASFRPAVGHGKSVDDVADQLPCTAEQAVNKLARITHSALFLMFNEASHAITVENSRLLAQQQQNVREA